ncbi:Tetraspanin-33 [Mactra antiquata]
MPSPWYDPDRSAVSLLVKYTLFLVNILIFLISGTVVALMTWVLVEKEKKVNNAYDFFLDPACVLCLAGCVAFVISFLGWFGALRENMPSLLAYKYTLMAIFFLEIALIIIIFVVVYVPDARQQLNIYPEDSLTQAIVKYRDDDDMQNLIDGIQQLLECCGTSNDDIGYKDWSQNAYFNCTPELEESGFGESCSVPFSCCIQENSGLVNYLCGKDMQSSKSDDVREETIYTKGCFKSITDILQSNVLVVGGVIIGILIPQMLLTFLTGKLISQIEIQMAKWKYER